MIEHEICDLLEERVGQKNMIQKAKLQRIKQKNGENLKRKY
jgi:hypothetical protein